MKVYTYSRARQQLATLLEEAARYGGVQIRRRDGRTFAVQPMKARRSPLDVPGVATEVTTKELVGAVRALRRGRGRTGRRRPR